MNITAKELGSFAAKAIMISISSSLRIPESIQRQICECLYRYSRLAERHFQRAFPLPRLVIHKKGAVAGTAHPQHYTIKLNGQLLMEHHDAFIEEVVPHELAHLLVYTVYGRVRPHGKEWQTLMQSVFNLPAKRTHTFINSALQTTRVPYQCACQIHYLSSVRHHRVCRQHAQYHCLQCKQKLTVVNRP